MSEAIQTNVGHDDESTAVEQLPPDAQRLGVDSSGLAHYYSRVRTSVYVLEGERIVYRRDDIEPGATLVGWVDHVANARGWSSLNLADSLPEALFGREGQH